jgi:hypothetical protein
MPNNVKITDYSVEEGYPRFYKRYVDHVLRNTKTMADNLSQRLTLHALTDTDVAVLDLLNDAFYKSLHLNAAKKDKSGSNGIINY